jgi:hypothetical protein
MPPIGYFVIPAFAFIGAGLKYIDAAYDEHRFQKGKTKYVSFLVIAVWVLLSIFDLTAALILLALLFAVMATGKVDNEDFVRGAFIVLVALVLTHTEIAFYDYDSLFLLVAAGIVDEKLNDRADHNTEHRKYSLLQHRPIMKAVMLGLCVFGVATFIYFFAFLSFDLSYETIPFLGVVDGHFRIGKNTNTAPKL